MPKVSAEHKDAVRRRILDAALRCLERNGYTDVTTREILAEAGLSTGTFYNYFPAKEDLYRVLAEEAMTRDVARILRHRTTTGEAGEAGAAARSDGAGSPADGLAGGLADGLAGFLRHDLLDEPGVAAAIAAFRAQAGEGAVGALSRHAVEAFAPVVRRAQADGLLRADLDPEALVELIDIIWDGLGRRAGADGFQTTWDRVARTVQTVLVAGAVAPSMLADPDR